MLSLFVALGRSRPQPQADDGGVKPPRTIGSSSRLLCRPTSKTHPATLSAGWHRSANLHTSHHRTAIWGSSGGHRPFVDVVRALVSHAGSSSPKKIRCIPYCSVAPHVMAGAMPETDGAWGRAHSAGGLRLGAWRRCGDDLEPGTCTDGCSHQRLTPHTRPVLRGRRHPPGEPQCRFSSHERPRFWIPEPGTPLRTATVTVTGPRERHGECWAADMFLRGTALHQHQAYEAMA